MNNKGFLLIDSLIIIVIVSLTSSLCLSIYYSFSNYEEGYRLYKEDINNNLINIYDGLQECEKCVIEEDLSNLEP